MGEYDPLNGITSGRVSPRKVVTCGKAMNAYHFPRTYPSIFVQFVSFEQGMEQLKLFELARSLLGDEPVKEHYTWVGLNGRVKAVDALAKLCAIATSVKFSEIGYAAKFKPRTIFPGAVLKDAVGVLRIPGTSSLGLARNIGRGAPFPLLTGGLEAQRGHGLAHADSLCPCGRRRSPARCGGRARGVQQLAESMDLFAQLLVNGIVNGSHYALLGLGFGVIFGPTRITHFAFGPLYALAAYAAWTAAVPLGLPLPLAVLIGILAGALSGFATYRVLYRPLERRQSRAWSC